MKIDVRNGWESQKEMKRKNQMLLVNDLLIHYLSNYHEHNKMLAMQRLHNSCE